MKMRKLLALGLGIVFAIGAVAGCGNQAAEKPAKETKAIVVGLDDNYPPMGFKNENNEIDGFDIDVAKEAAKRLGRPVEFKAIDWDSKEAELKSGSEASLMVFAQTLAQRFSLTPEPRSKFRRSLDLSKGE